MCLRRTNDANIRYFIREQFISEYSDKLLADICQQIEEKYTLMLFTITLSINSTLPEKNDGNQKITYAVQAKLSSDFGLIFAILCRFLPLGVVFYPSTTATSCQDADFFPAMICISIFTGT